MPETNRSIGGEGLEQGGMDLGNDISRKDLSTKNAGDALTNTPTMGSSNDQTDLEDDELDDDEMLADDELEEDDTDDVIDDDDTALLPDEEDSDDDVLADTDDTDEDEEDTNV